MTEPRFNILNSKLIPLVLIILSLVGLYFDIFVGMIEDWSTNDNYSHGFFIPLISIYMIYSMRDELETRKIQPCYLGLLILILGLAQLIIGKAGSEFFVQRTSIIPVLFGITLFLWGVSFTKNLLVPILYLIFMIPLPAILWNKIAFPMQLFSSAVTQEVVWMLGIPIFREGNILHLATTTLEVVAACSGLRSLTTMFALSSIISWYTFCSSSKKWIIFFSAAPIAIFCNIVRLTITAILASIFGGEVADGFLHDFSGFFVFGLGLFSLYLVSKTLIRIRIKKAA